MSIVLALKSKHGIIMMADSKPVKICSDGVLSDEIKSVTNIFSNEKMIVGQHRHSVGLAEIAMQESFVEDVLVGLMTSSAIKTPQQFCEGFQRELSVRGSKTVCLDYAFVIGAKENGNFTLYHASAIKQSGEHLLKRIDGGYLFASAHDYSPTYTDIPDDATINQMVEIGKGIFPTTLEFCNLLDGPIQTATLI